MATRDSRVKKELKFVSGIKDPYNSVNQNVYLYTVNDEIGGSRAYFKPKHCEITTTEVTTNTAPFVVKIPAALKTGTFGDVFINTVADENNIYVSTYSVPDSFEARLSGGNVATWVADISGAFFADIIDISDTATSQKANIITVEQSQNIYYIENSFGSDVVYVTGFPVTPRGAYLDGYLFLNERNTEKIYNSNLNDPSTWNTGVNFISASQYPGNITALARTKNYIIAFKESSIEYFYNAGLTNTSPLQRVPQYTKRIGTRYDDQNCMAQYKDKIFFLYTQENRNREVHMLEGENSVKISTDIIEEMLRLNSVFVERGNVVNIGQRSYYILDCSFFSLVYDIEMKIWYKWLSGSSELGYIAGTSYQSNEGSFVYQFNYPAGIGNLVIKQLGFYSMYDIGTIVPTQYILDIPETNLGSPNRKYIKDIVEDCILPSVGTSEVTLENLVGGQWTTRTKSKDNPDSPSFHTFGESRAFKTTYTFTVPAGGDLQSSQFVQFNGLILDVQDGSS